MKDSEMRHLTLLQSTIVELKIYSYASLEHMAKGEAINITTIAHTKYNKNLERRREQLKNKYITKYPLYCDVVYNGDKRIEI